MFCTSVLGYRHIHSKFIIAPMIHDRESDMIEGEREKELCVILTMFSLFVPLLCSSILLVNVMHFL